MSAGGGAPPPANPVYLTAPGPMQSSLPATLDNTPHVVVDASPLQQAMDKNKESLKVKLMLRRPLNQLVAQGIMPPLKSPPAFHEQRRQLERAKTGDLLKAKIQRRPDRQELERRHILEQQEGHVDPSLAEKQRMLKKARLADQLNDQLSHRPGPLELIKKNILHTEEPIEIAVKQGLVAFKATSEGALRRPEHPSSYLGPDDDSPTPSPPSPTPTTTSTLSPASAAASPRSETLVSIAVPPAPPPLPLPQLTPSSLIHSSISKDRNRKKSKSKSIPKARTIKFHEYKGPPSAHKSSSPPLAPGETSYELLLRQQQLFLQWQLESQHKYPQLIFSSKPRNVPIASLSALSPAASVVSVTSITSVSSEASDNSSQQPPSPASPAIPPPPPLPVKLEDMKVSDLKAELKRRSLPVSGPKPLLIERLRPFMTDRCTPLNALNDDCKSEIPSSPASIAGSPETHSETMDSESQPPTPQPAEDIVRSQQRRIEELQRELQRSQQQLEAVKRDSATPAPARRLALHHLQAKIHSHQLAAHIQQLQQMQAAAERRPPTSAPLVNSIPLTPIAPAVPIPPPPPAHTPQPARYVLAAEPTTERLLRLVPAGDGLKMQFTLKDGLEGIEGIDGFDCKKNVGLVLNGVKVVPVTLVPSEPPPRYEEIARSNTAMITISPPPPPPLPLPAPPANVTVQQSEPSVKSEIVDDVLEILIKNGELPASAANIPLQSMQDIASQNGDDFMNSALSESLLHHDDISNHMLNSTDIQNNMIDEQMQRALLSHDSLQDDLNVIQNELLNSSALENDMMNGGSIQDDNKLHESLLRNGNEKGDLIDDNHYADFIMHNSHDDQNNSHNNYLSQNNITDDLMDQGSILMNGPNEMSIGVAQQNGHCNGIDEGSLLDDLIHHSNNLSTGHDGMNQTHHDFPLSDLSFHDHSMPAINDDDPSSQRHSFMNSPSNRCGDGLDLKELGLDLESLDSTDLGRMDCSSAEPMDTDEWLESLWPRSQPGQCDPLLGGAPTRPAPRPARPHFSWDRIDFAAT